MIQKLENLIRFERRVPIVADRSNSMLTSCDVATTSVLWAKFSPVPMKRWPWPNWFPRFVHSPDHRQRTAERPGQPSQVFGRFSSVFQCHWWQSAGYHPCCCWVLAYLCPVTAYWWFRRWSRPGRRWCRRCYHFELQPVQFGVYSYTLMKNARKWIAINVYLPSAVPPPSSPGTQPKWNMPISFYNLWVRIQLWKTNAKRSTSLSFGAQTNETYLFVLRVFIPEGRGPDEMQFSNYFKCFPTKNEFESFNQIPLCYCSASNANESNLCQSELKLNNLMNSEVTFVHQIAI